MARLTAKARAKIPTSQFAGPGRTYPVQDKKHAAVAKAFAAMHHSKFEKSIDAKADRVLSKGKKK